MKPGILLGAVTSVLAATGGAVEPQSWRYAHSDAQVLAGVDLKRLQDTPAGRQLWSRFTHTLGPLLMGRAERLLLSSVSGEDGRRSEILILSGPFELSRLRKMVVAEGAGMSSFLGLDIAAPPGAALADPHMAWAANGAGGTTVLIGTRPAIQAAAERSGARAEPMAAANGMFARALTLAAQSPVWVVCDGLPSGLGPKGLDAVLDDEDSGVNVTGFDLALRLGDKAELDVRVSASTEEAAGKVLEALQTSAHAGSGFVLAPWLPDFTGVLEGTSLVLSAACAPARVEDRAVQLLAAFALPLDARAAPAPKPPEPKPETPQRLFVRIEGLEEGAKEIPYQTGK